MQIEFKATKREEQGSSASRRLRRAGRLPGVIYGGGKDAVAISMDHNDLYHALSKEAFHSSVLTADVDGTKESVVLRDAQWHLYKQQVLHIDFLRVDATHEISLKVPLHFINGEISPAVKLGGCMISHTMNEVEVKCLPGNLPEFIEVDLTKLEAGQSIHVSELVLPQGVSLVTHGEGDPVIATALQTKGGPAEEAEGAEAA
jgi:large subunit ribosomal protein L25